MVTFSMTMTEP